MTDLDFRTIGLKIKERRLSQGITQEVIANHLDVNPSHISNIENGRANPSLTALIKIANVLQCSVDCFINAEYTYAINENKEEYKLRSCTVEAPNGTFKILAKVCANKVLPQPVGPIINMFDFSISMSS